MRTYSADCAAAPGGYKTRAARGVATNTNRTYLRHQHVQVARLVVLVEDFVQLRRQ